MNRRRPTVRAGLLLTCAFELAHAGSARAQVLVIGRQDQPSVAASISEHVAIEAARRAGVALSMRPLPLPRVIESANDGEIDGDLMRIADVVERYPNLLKVPTPVNQIDVAVYGRSEAMRRMPREEIPRLRIAYARGTFIVAKHAAGLKAVQAKSIDLAFDMLANGRVDAVMGTYIDAEQSLMNHGRAGVVRWPIAWASEPVYLLLHKRHAEWVPRLDAALRQMKHERLIEAYYVQGLQAARITPLAPPRSRPR